MNHAKNRFDHINQRIAAALAHISSNNNNRMVTLLAVSKRHSIEKIRELYMLGQRDFGESYLQEALEKIQQTSDLDIRWHFIGPIQSNKTRAIAKHFDWVHSVDRIKIANRLNEQRPLHLPPLNVCLQVNIDNEAQKAGLTPDELEQSINAFTELPRLRVRGLMVIPRPRNTTSEQQKPFSKLRTLKDKMNQQYHLNMDTLSMGMSSDLEAAIIEGATIIRIGTALFGQRE